MANADRERVQQQLRDSRDQLGILARLAADAFRMSESMQGYAQQESATAQESWTDADERWLQAWLFATGSALGSALELEAPSVCA